MIILISRSGSTAGKLLNHLPLVRREDTQVISNRNSVEGLDSYFLTQHPISFAKHQEIEEMLLRIEPTRVLLIGYLRILSKEVCERHEIYNVHPADIVNYPELKGKDPIERVYQEDPAHIKYDRLGVVLHRVIPEVDEGQILYLETFDRPQTIELAYHRSDKAALNLWKKLLDIE